MNTELRWVKATERLPELPNPLPPDTEDERGVLFVNRKHSSAFLWFPSYGHPAVSSLHITPDGHWALDQWEWLEEYSTQKEELPAPDVEQLAEEVVNEGKWGYPIEGDGPSEMMFAVCKEYFLKGYKAALPVDAEKEAMDLLNQWLDLEAEYIKPTDNYQPSDLERGYRKALLDVKEKLQSLQTPQP